MKTADLYKEYLTKMQKIADVKYAHSVLEWDTETYLPVKGIEMRNRQMATLSELAHEFSTDTGLGNLLLKLNDCTDLSTTEKSNAALSLVDYNRNKKLSPAFVKKMSVTVQKAYHSWVKARQLNNGTQFIEPLQQLIDLKKQEADSLGYEGHPYNALMNDYDPGLTVKIVDDVFLNLQPALRNLISITNKQPSIKNDFLQQFYEKDLQWNFGMELIKKIGFDLEAGRQDISIHPFTTNFNPADVRLTTRIDEHDLGNMTWSCLHEAGHGLYEQGLPANQYGLPLGNYCSLSIHESQSRIWENQVGRSLAFWEHNFPVLKTFFPQQLKEITAETFYAGINKVQPSLIRTEADELTYHFHIMIRYEIEKLLIEGSIGAKDIASYWNELYKKQLDILVPDDNQGFLQDIHWSHGSIGYFATYSTGSLYAAQFFDSIEKENFKLNQEISNGNTSAVLQWLRNNIHQYGRQFNSEALCKKATGSNLNAQFFIDYATKKFKNIYKL